MFPSVILTGFLVLLVSFTNADDVQNAEYNVKVKGVFGFNTTSTKVTLDKTKETVDVTVGADPSNESTFAGGSSFVNVKENFIVIQPEPMKDRCLLVVPTAPLKLEDFEVLLTPPGNDGILPYVKCYYKDYVSADYSQEVQAAGPTVCQTGKFTGVLENCSEAPSDKENIFCFLCGILLPTTTHGLTCLIEATEAIAN